MEREQWLKSLKKGDKVANKTKKYTSDGYSYIYYEVKNITLKGNIRLANGILLNEYGEYHKFENWCSTDYKIEPITEETLKYEKDRKEQLSLYLEISKLLEQQSRKCKSWTIEQLKNIKEFINNIEKEVE